MMSHQSINDLLLNMFDKPIHILLNIHTMKHILKCPKCGSYGMKAECSCGHTRLEPKPPKYSPEDRYAKYRRQAKELIEQEDEKSQTI
jgi:H/ACA ribonucleoprotein complex subunit 3